MGTRKPLGSRAESVRRWPRALAGATAPSPQKSLEPGERQTVLCPRLRKLTSCHIRTSGQAQVPKKTGKKINRALLASGCEPLSSTLADGKEMPWELAALCPLRVFGREPGPELGDAWGRLGSLVEEPACLIPPPVRVAAPRGLPLAVGGRSAGTGSEQRGLEGHNVQSGTCGHSQPLAGRDGERSGGEASPVYPAPLGGRGPPAHSCTH